MRGLAPGPCPECGVLPTRERPHAVSYLPIGSRLAAFSDIETIEADCASCGHHWCVRAGCVEVPPEYA